jgi:hypothetical protein
MEEVGSRNEFEVIDGQSEKLFKSGEMLRRQAGVGKGCGKWLGLRRRDRGKLSVCDFLQDFKKYVDVGCENSGIMVSSDRTAPPPHRRGFRR